MKKLIFRFYPAFINIYSVWMLYLLFFATFRDSPDQTFNIKTIPFETIDEYFFNVIHYDKLEFFKNILGNIILFVPYGFLGILYPKLNKIEWLFPSFFVVINIIEFSQFYFKRGFADIDDIILNTFGVVLGYVIYKSFFYIKDR